MANTLPERFAIYWRSQINYTVFTVNHEIKYLAEKTDLPHWFEYPEGFRVLVQQGLVDFAPWHLADIYFARKTYPFLRDRYSRELFPLARRQGSDDLACVEKDTGEIVKIVNGYTSSGHEVEGEFETFWIWFRSAIDELIEFSS
jgi:hypothetical protein